MAVDYVQGQLKQEAARYRSQFSDSIAGDSFWTIDPNNNLTIISTRVQLEPECKVLSTIRDPASTKDVNCWILSRSDNASVYQIKWPLSSPPSYSYRVTQVVNKKSASSTVSFTLGQKYPDEIKPIYDGPNMDYSYKGFEIVRKTTLYNSDEDPAFRLICQILPSHDRTVFLIRPVYLRIESVRAKVLYTQWYNPLTWPNYFAGTSGDTTDEDIAIDIDGIWVDGSQTTHTGSLASFTVPVHGYNLDKHQTICDNGQKCDRKWKNDVGGWFAAVPRSDAPGTNMPIGAGTFWLRTTVVEKDPSNAQQLINEAATQVGKHRQDVVNYATKLINPEASPSPTPAAK
jgi:hypothetical protein